MSFIQSAFADHPLRTREQVMDIIVQVADELDMPDKRGACVCAGMCVAREAGSDQDDDDIPEFWCPANRADPESFDYPHDSESDDGRSVGYFQQQKSSTGALWWGPTSSEMDLHSACTEFMKRLKKAGYNASNARTANDSVQHVQQSGRPDAYAEFWQLANDVYDNVVATDNQSDEENVVAWTGDPVWLEDVLRPALGNRLKTLTGWQDLGHGDFNDIRGVMVHHTGNGRASAQSIRDGRPDLEGPLSNLHIAQDGTVTIVAVGVCWHAGEGSYPWLPTNNANWHMIGIECAWPMDVNNKAERWPDAQIISMRDTCAALATKLRVDANRVIGHKEYAGAAQGKWDPGNMSMPWFRGEVAKDMRGEFDNQVPKPTPVQPGPILPPDYAKEVWDQVRIEWPQLGGQTLVNALAEIRDKVCGTSDKDKR